jgi:hypothetical protein
MENTVPIKINTPEFIENSTQNSFSFFNKIKEYKLYLLIFIGIISVSVILYNMYIKKKAKQLSNNVNGMLDVVESFDQSDKKLLYNPIDKQYYNLDSSGNPIKTTLDNYHQQSQQQSQQQMAQQQMAQQQMAQQQMAQQQMAQQQMAQQQIAQHQMAQQQKAQQQKAPQQKAQQQMASQQKKQQILNNKGKLKHQVESSSENETSDYNIPEIDEGENISQFNLNSEDINDIKSGLSDNN